MSWGLRRASLPSSMPTDDTIELLPPEWEARIVLEMRSLPNVAGPQLAAARGLCRRLVSSCEACRLVDAMPHGPVPFTGPEAGGEPLFAAIGEGPGQQETRQGRPFVGPAGKLLRAMLAQVGLPASQVLFANVVSCWPRTGEGKNVKARTPTNDEMMACRYNLDAQVQLSTRPYVLLVGGTALKAVRPDLKVSDIHGRLFVWQRPEGSRWVMPILHPAAILRQQAFKEGTIRELRQWADIVLGEADPMAVLPDTCVKCGHYLDHIDPDGIGYCQAHWGRYGGNWQLARTAWDKKADGPEQPSLL